MNDRTYYSDEVAGARGNYNWPVTYDVTGGYVGITQKADDGTVKDRVLLSPEQVKALTEFLAQQRR
jgi:hypothetical protein